MKLYPERINKAYDRLREPWRFVYAMLVISPAFFHQTLPVVWQGIVLLWCALLMFFRSAYLCKLEYVPPRRRS